MIEVFIKELTRDEKIKIEELEGKFRNNMLVKKVICESKYSFEKKINEEILWAKNHRRELNQKKEVYQGITITVSENSINGIDISKAPYKYRDLTEIEILAVAKLIGDTISEFIAKRCKKGPGGTMAEVAVEYENGKSYGGWCDVCDVHIRWSASNGYKDKVKGKEWY